MTAEQRDHSLQMHIQCYPLGPAMFPFCRPFKRSCVWSVTARRRTKFGARSCFYSHVSFCLHVWLTGPMFLLWGSLSERGLCPAESLCPGGFMSKGSLSSRVSVQGFSVLEDPPRTATSRSWHPNRMLSCIVISLHSEGKFTIYTLLLRIQTSKIGSVSNVCR